MAFDTLVPLPFGGFAVVPAVVAEPPPPRPPTAEERAYVIAGCQRLLAQLAEQDLRKIRGISAYRTFP